MKSFLHALTVLLIVLSICSLLVCLTPKAEPIERSEVTTENTTALSATPMLNFTQTISRADINISKTTLDEIDTPEGAHPLYVLVFADKEEREDWERYNRDWRDYAIMQIERGDRHLASTFGIDIRILDLISFDNIWESDDNLTSMYDIWDDFAYETSCFLGCYYNGPYWQNYVDAIMGITGQYTDDDVAGLAPNKELVDQGKSIILLKWSLVYWADDNIVQHEISHLFYASDHWNTDAPCCTMTQSHYHYVREVTEDDGGSFMVYGYVLCAYLQNGWCSGCKNILNLYKSLYQEASPSPPKLIVRQEEMYNPQGSLSHTGVYIYESPTMVTVSAVPNYGYMFSHWILDSNQQIDSQQVTINVDKRHTLVAYFKIAPKVQLTIQTNGAGGTTNPAAEIYTYYYGDVVTVEAFPSSGYRFLYWTLNGNILSYASKITITMDANYTLTAYFTRRYSGGVGGAFRCYLM